MDKSDLFRHAVNIADFFRVVEKFVNQGAWDAEQGIPTRPLTPDEFHRRHDEFGDPLDPLDLADLGLDDMSLSRVVIELSQTRDHFKVWTPFQQQFVTALKSSIPTRSRRWDEDERCWRIDCYWFGNAQDLFPQYFPDLERFYTERAIKMCEQLAQEGLEEEDTAPKKKRAKTKAKAKAKAKTKAKAKYKNNKEDTSSHKRVFWEDEEDEEDDFNSPGEDPYEVLGVSKKAPDEVIKAAHKALARKYHTDSTGIGDDTDMKRVNAAFEKIKEIRKW